MSSIGGIGGSGGIPPVPPGGDGGGGPPKVPPGGGPPPGDSAHFSSMATAFAAVLEWSAHLPRYCAGCTKSGIIVERPSGA